MIHTDKEKAELICRISNVDTKKCMKCGKCSASCPAYDSMDIRPHQFVSYVDRGEIDEIQIHLEMPFLFCMCGALPA